MVLVSNEWQNKCEDVPKTAITTSTTANNTTTAPTTSSSSPATSTAASICEPSESIPGTGTNIITKNRNNSETVAGDLINSITATTSIISTETAKAKPESTITTTATKINKTLANDNASNEQINKIIKDKSSIEIAYKNKINDVDDIGECKIAEVGKLFPTAKQLKEDDNLNETVLNFNNSIKRMAENTKESPLKEEKEEEDMQTQDLISNHHTGNIKDLVDLNSFENSNTNTLTTASITVKTQQNNQQQNIITQQQVPLSCPITPQALSSALQSALNATNNANNANNSVAAAGLQPNFLSQLALTANVAGLQKPTTTATTILTAKQLNQSFITSDLSNQNKSDSNISEATLSTTVPAATYDNNGQAKIVLICEGNSHPFQTRSISLTPNVECMVGRLIAKSKASENNAIFDCKVLSRKHAVIWYTTDGKFWVKDTKSSNGTFINDNKLGDEEAELHFGDIVKFGVDVLENSRKEVHGCIIACVKLYLPDGREAISIDTSVHRSQYSGESHISYDELHRLNLYIQETSQREKVLTSKLCNIQNVLDATRKNSALCWQSMITEDQLLHRIHSLEKKLQFMEKNVPENILRNEVLKLLDDKNSYQHTAKEALRKVYQERCDAMQMLSKMESAYTQSENECTLLRDEIMSSNKTLQDVNTRLLRLEAEYHEYKEEVAQQEKEAKDREERRIKELTEKLCQRELECVDLKNNISDLLLKRAKELEDEEHLLEKQAIEKLDAAIADMDLGDDEYSSNEDDDDVNEVDVANKILDNKEEEEAKQADNVVDQGKESKFAINTKKPTTTRPSIFGNKFNGVEQQQQQDNNSKTNFHAPKLSKLKKAKLKSPPKRVKETTIMKWLQNSDINKNEGSFDIFKAICNENDDDESEECGILTEQELRNTKPIQMPDSLTINETGLFCNFTKKLKNVQKYLKQLEAEIENEMKDETCAMDDIQLKVKSENVDNGSSDEEGADDAEEGACAGEEFIITSNGKTGTPSEDQVLAIENKKYLLLKTSVDMLREAYNEIWHGMKEQEATHCHKQKEQYKEKEKSPPPNIKIKTQLQTFKESPTTGASTKSENQTNRPSSESDNAESDSEAESLTLSSPINSSRSPTVVEVETNAANNPQLLEKLQNYQSQVKVLNKKLQQTELEAHHTMEIMQVECDDVKMKMGNLNNTVESLQNEKMVLEQVITEKQNDSPNRSIPTKVCKENDTQRENELELEEDPVLKSINVTALEREEELITYKERLDEQQRENIDLRNEIALLKQKTLPGTTKDVLLKQYLPYGFIVIAIIIYFLTTYH